tara:strand:+ start:749 stop:1819 length:1071 start_codon:yes stop_codon:yes gene_type:complete
MKDTNIIFIGDPHFQVSNIKEVDNFIIKLCKILEDRKESLSLIVVAGDLLHSHEKLHTTALNKAYEFLDKLRKICKTYVLVGNHDMINNQQFLTENHWMNSIKEWDNIIIVDKVKYEIINNNKFVFVPYVFNGRFQDALNTLNIEWRDSKCIFAHQEFYGCSMGAILSVDGDKWPLDYPYVISGHIHSKQTPQENIFYSGASMQHAFGESQENIIAYLTFIESETKYKIEEIDLGLTRKKILYLDAENLEEFVLPDTKDKLKLTISGIYEEFKDFKKSKKYKKLIDKGVKINFKQKKKEVLKKEQFQNSIINDNNTYDFKNILNILVNEEKNCKINEIYELIINNKKVNSKDLLFL